MKNPLENTEPILNVREVRKLIKNKKRTELTTYMGKYHLLHITSNNVPIPLIITKDLKQIKDEIILRGL
jgi:hypothetical protein